MDQEEFEKIIKENKIEVFDFAVYEDGYLEGKKIGIRQGIAIGFIISSFLYILLNYLF